MEGIAGTESTNKIQPDTPAVEKPKEEKGGFDGSKFESFLKAQFNDGSAQSVSEEALFASLVRERIESLRGVEVAERFSTQMETAKLSLTRSDGFVSYEDSAKSALRDLRTSGSLSAEETDKVYSEAFAAAQLDGNTDSLFDDRGDESDTTVATGDFATVLTSSKDLLAKIVSGEIAATARSVDEASYGHGGSDSMLSSGLLAGDLSSDLLESDEDLTSGITLASDGSVNTPDGNTFDGPKGFLFKPISNNEEKLAVLLPPEFLGKVTAVTLQDELGAILDQGKSTGTGEEGIQEKFAFNKQGGEYPQNITVNVQFLDGTSKAYKIPDPSQRYD